LNDKGIAAGVMNMPTTYPPKKINRFMISGTPDAGMNYAYPTELKEELEKKFNYHIITSKSDIMLYSHEIVAQSLQNTIDMRFKAFNHLYTKFPDIAFFHLSIFHINSLHHNFWDQEYTKEGWRIIDKHIGEYVHNPEINVLFMSDHGSHKIKSKFNINTWLEQKGYLKFSKKKKLFEFLSKIGLNQHAIAQKIKKTGLDPQKIKVYVPKAILHFFPTYKHEIKKEAKTKVIDWDKTKAIASGQGVVYIKKSNVKRYNEFRQELKDNIKKIVNPETGEPIAKEVYFKEEIYSGKYLDEAPDIIIDQKRGVFIAGGVGKKEIFEKSKKWEGENKTTGFFMAIGPDFKKGYEIKNMSILDICPTILKLFEIPAPKDLDGTVRTDLFNNE
jgi:predicted AlkP superfamily phosphohydrolase/phosphomutase